MSETHTLLYLGFYVTIDYCIQYCKMTKTKAYAYSNSNIVLKARKNKDIKVFLFKIFSNAIAQCRCCPTLLF